jgi:hypothetical protein
VQGLREAGLPEAALYNTPSALTGINIYLPGGSFDITFTHSERGNRSLLQGYTVHIGGGK